MVEISRTTRPLAVYTDAEDIDPAAGIQLLQEAGFEVRFLHSLDPGVIAEAARDAVALLVGYAEVTAGMIAQMPTLRIISLISMGFNNIDVDAATERGVWVTNLPGVATEEVASHALSLSMALVRNLPFYERAIVAGDWLAVPPVIPPRLSESTLGIVGLGRIGLRLGTMASKVFGQVIGFDPLLPDTVATTQQLTAAGIVRTNFDEVIEASTVLSLHLPLTPETENLINAEVLTRMRPHSYLVNVSRGHLVDSQAVSDAIDSGHLAGVALDVLDVEPAGPDHPLIDERTNVIVTPHVAYLSTFTLREYVRAQALNVIDWKTNGRPSQPVNDINIEGAA